MHHSFQTNASQFSTNTSQFSINASQFSTFSNKVLELLQSYGSLAGVWRMAASGQLPSWAIQQHLKKSTTLTIVLLPYISPAAYNTKYFYILPWLLSPINTSMRASGSIWHCRKAACSDVRGRPVTWKLQKFLSGLNWFQKLRQLSTS